MLGWLVVGALAQDVDRGALVMGQQAAEISVPRDEMNARLQAWLDMQSSNGFTLLRALHTEGTDTYVVGVRQSFGARGALFDGSLDLILWAELRDGRFRVTTSPVVHVGQVRSLGFVGSSTDPGPGACSPSCYGPRSSAWREAYDDAVDLRTRVNQGVVDALTTPVVPGPTVW